MVVFRFCALLFTLVSYTLADVQFTLPASGTSVGFGPLSIAWSEGGGKTKLTDLTGYTLFLMVGGNGDGTDPTIATIVASTAGSHSTGMTTKLPLPAPAVGPPGNLAYFLKMQSTAKDGSGQYVFNYSDRFTINGMTGAWDPKIQAAYKKVTDKTQVPATVNQITGNGGAPAGGGAAGGGNAPVPTASGPYAVPFAMQTGATRYAPMQERPPSAITKQDTSPLNPTSNYIPAQQYLAIPTVVTTLTLANPFSTTSRVNTASPAPQPEDDMQRFLARWRD